MSKTLEMRVLDFERPEGTYNIPINNKGYTTLNIIGNDAPILYKDAPITRYLRYLDFKSPSELIFINKTTKNVAGANLLKEISESSAYLIFP